MKNHAAVENFGDFRSEPRQLHLAIGMFDGVHLGHQAVIESAVHNARHKEAASGVLTFFPHPSRIIGKGHPTLLIMPPRLKEEMLRVFGVDHVIWKKFTPDFAATPAGHFVPLLKQHLPSLAAIYVGENFHFGKGRAGDIQTLIDDGQRFGINVYSAERIKCDGERISSSRIREALLKGDVARAGAMLGYPYFAEGPVRGGQHLGRKLGYPTLNVPWNPELRPRYGVYVTRIKTGGHNNTHSYAPAVANYGLRPTIGDQDTPLLEVHLLQKTETGTTAYGNPGGCQTGIKPVTTRLSESDIVLPQAAEVVETSGDTAANPFQFPEHEERVSVEFLDFIRPEQKFDDLDQLQRQIGEDKSRAVAWFNSKH